MTKARDLANIISGGFTADDIPNLDAAKITSGSFADARIPNLAASKITSGTFADARIASSNVSQHATSFDDNKLVNDISTLALRQASNENKSAYNTNSMYIDVLQDSTGITSLTNVERNVNEYISSAVYGTATRIDQTNPFQAGGGTAAYQYKTLNSQSYATSFTDMPQSGTSAQRNFDFNYAMDGGSYPVHTRTLGLTSYITYDYKEIKRFSTNLEIGKAPTHGDLNQAKIQYSTDDVNYTDLDLSGASVVGDNPQYSTSGLSGGALSNFAADGTFKLLELWELNFKVFQQLMLDTLDTTQ